MKEQKIDPFKKYPDLDGVGTYMKSIHSEYSLKVAAPSQGN
jgi:hypothetical protein